MNKKWQADIVVNEGLVVKLLRAQFPTLELTEISCIGEGWDNCAFLVNQTIIFRFPRRKIAVELIEQENKLLKHLQSYFTLQIPNPIFLGRSSEEYPYSFHGYQLIKGLPAEEALLTSQQRLASLQPLALFLRKLHSIGEKQALEMGAKPHSGKTMATFQERVNQLVALGYRIDEQQIQQEIKVIQEIKLSNFKCLVHGDLYCRHLIFNEGQLTGIIDWGDVGISSPAMDLAVIWTFYPKKYHPLFLEIYGAVDPNSWHYARFLGLYIAITLILYGQDIGNTQLLSEAKESVQRINARIFSDG
ncbi:MAG: phosphotransferase [Pseudomonadota bacterium]